MYYIMLYMCTLYFIVIYWAQLEVAPLTMRRSVSSRDANMPHADKPKQTRTLALTRHTRVCVCVCVRARAYVRACVCVRACAYVRARVCADAYCLHNNYYVSRLRMAQPSIA